MDIYCNSWYGAMLWDLYGEAAGMAFRSWNTTVKIAWGLDRATHTYIVDHLLTENTPSVRHQIIKRYIKFVTTLLHCKCHNFPLGNFSCELCAEYNWEKRGQHQGGVWDEPFDNSKEQFCDQESFYT